MAEIAHEEGRYTPAGGYEYYLKDHLGNTRVVLGQAGVTQWTDYDPWGWELPALSSGASTNRTKFNGQESMPEIGPGMLDFGHRGYDATIGRMNRVDAAAEVFAEVSPFSFGLNNPVMNVDPTGDTTVPAAQVDWHTFDTQTNDIGLNEVKVTEQRQSTGNNQQGSMVIPPLEMPLMRPSLPTIPSIVGRAGLVGAAAYAGWQLGPALARRMDDIVDEMAQLMEKTGVPHGTLYGPRNLTYTPPPRNLPGFPDATKERPKSGGSARWVTPDGKILEWDSQHGDVEVYNGRGRHQGSADPNTGQMIKDPVPGRKTVK